MADIFLEYNESEDYFDIDFFEGDIKYDTAPVSDCIASIFTYNRLSNYEQKDLFLQFGWNGNPYYSTVMGSSFEIYSKQLALTQNNLNRMVDTSQQGLQWLVDDTIIDSFTIAVIPDKDILNMEIDFSEDADLTSIVLKTRF